MYSRRKMQDVLHYERRCALESLSRRVTLWTLDAYRAEFRDRDQERELDRIEMRSGTSPDLESTEEFGLES